MLKFNSSIKVDIIVLYEALEALAIRSLLESFGIPVRMHYIGSAKQLVSLFKKHDLYKIVIISCHGDKTGLLLPELSKDLVKEQPFHKHLKPKDLLNFLDLQDQIVINTGCCLGDLFSDNFVAKGASAHIGAIDYIEGSTMVLFIVNFLHFFILKKIPLLQAFKQACRIDPELKIMKLKCNKKIRSYKLGARPSFDEHNA